MAGEICIAGQGLARGYLADDPSANARFVIAPDGARHYRSGDLGWARYDGMLFCTGRMDEQVKIRGNRIELGDVEAALSSHPSVQSAVALSVADCAGESELFAFVSLNPQPELERSGDARALEQEHVSEWQTLYESVYDLRDRDSSREPDARFDTRGWVSSYDGKPIAREAMRDWLDATLARLRALNPRRVLEIGCGTGMIASALAPSCQRYIGCDFSAPAIELARVALGASTTNVRLVQAAAHEIGTLGERGFDLVILNSVVQYFPSAPYLVDVLAQACTLLAPGGRIFIGDVRHFGLIEAFHADAQSARADAGIAVAELRERVRVAVVQDKELLLAPAFFWQAAELVPELRSVSVRLKRGSVRNEMRDYRYDVLLQTAPAPATPAIEWHDWRREGLTSATLRTWLQDRQGPLGLSAITNARVRRGALLQAQLADESDASDAASFPEGVEPRRWRDSANRSAGMSSYCLRPTRPMSFAPCCTRAAHGFANDAHLFPRRERTRGRIASNPLLATMGTSLESRLKDWLGEHVPSAMVPVRIEPLPRIPLLSNGKADRVALADLAAARRRAPVSRFVAPANALEALVSEVWTFVFRLKQVSVEDHFFNELGGHSLLATQVVSRIRSALEADFPLRLLFRASDGAPLVRGVARVARQWRPRAHRGSGARGRIAGRGGTRRTSGAGRANYFMNTISTNADEKRRALLNKLIAERGLIRAAPDGGLGTGAGIPRRAPGLEKLPQSFAQQRLWFLDRLAPGNPFYTVSVCIPITGCGRCDCAHAGAG
jgi:SAM-dependent methyltransferase